MNYYLTKKFSFDAAHFIPNYPGKCAKLHGHHFVAEVTVCGEKLNELGMLIDFNTLMSVAGKIVEKFDHTLLNDSIEICPTAEHLAGGILATFEYYLLDNDDVNVYSVKVWEGENSCVELRE
jgi:6-pyruvoyltetrahydropterin/6-carboxytetrahydropterin synthase